MKFVALSVFLFGVVSGVSVINPWDSESIQNNFKRNALIESIKSQLQNHAIKRLADQSIKRKQTASLRKTLTKYRRDEIDGTVQPPMHCFAAFSCPRTPLHMITPQVTEDETLIFPDGYLDNLCMFVTELIGCYESDRYEKCDEMDEIMNNIGSVSGYICGEGRAATTALLDCISDVRVQNNAKALFKTVESIDDNLNLDFLGDPDNVCCAIRLGKKAVGGFLEKQCHDKSAVTAAEKLLDMSVVSEMLDINMENC